MALYGFIENSRYKRTVSEYAAFRQQITVLYDKTQQLQALKLQYAQKQIDEATNEHSLLVQKIKADYEKRNKVNLNTIDDLRTRLRDQIRADINAVPIAENPDWTTEQWGERYSAVIRQYDTLVDACKVTTLDYNNLRTWADEACLIAECK